MKLREKTNSDICTENQLPYTILTNVVEEKSTKDRMRATSELIAKALTATLGPYGSSTLIQDREKKHFATKDGYDLMNRLSFDDEISRTILDLFRTTASSQVYTVGDGSTSAIIVANALFQTLTDPKNKEKFERIAPKDINDILNDIEVLVEEEVRKLARPVSADMHELDNIAAVANNNDTETGKLIADIYRKIGEYGFISMDVLDKKDKDEYEIKTGIEWDRGFADPIFTRFTTDDKITYDQNPRVILANCTLTYDDLEFGLMPLMKEALNQEGAELLIVANDFDEDVLNFLRSNRTKHQRIGSKDVEMVFTAVDIDQVTKESRNKLEDLALVCGCRIYNKFTTKPADVVAYTKSFIGHADKIVVTPKKTEVIAKEPSPELKKEISKKVSEYEKELEKLSSIEVPNKEEDLKIYELRQRLSRIKGSTALFHVAGKTLSERMTRQRLIEDAVFSCANTLKNGYIYGGNLVVPKVLIEHKDEFVEKLLKKYTYLSVKDSKEFLSYFVDIITDSFLESYRAVLENSYMSQEEVEKTIKNCLEKSMFYNLKTHSYDSMETTSVINSVETDISILRNCCSLIGILSTSNQMITINMSVLDQIKK